MRQAFLTGTSFRIRNRGGFQAAMRVPAPLNQGMDKGGAGR